MASHTFAGIRFPGRAAVDRITEELDRQKKSKKDQLIRTDRMAFKPIDGQFLLSFKTKEENLVAINRTAWNQVSEYVGLPVSSGYWNWASGEDNWGKWANTLNEYFHAKKDYRLLRVLEKDGQPYLRAFLSNAYKIVDHSDFLFAIADRLVECKAEMWHCRLTEDRFVGYAVAPGITDQVKTDRTFDPGDGWKSRWYGKDGDVVNAAMAFGNSETGGGSCFLRKAILRRVCQNYCVWEDVVAKTHIGRRREDEMVLSAETVKAENEVFFMKIKDHVVGTFDPEKFHQLFELMNKAAEDDIDPDHAEDAAQALRITCDLSQERMERIKTLFNRNGDFSRFGLFNALTEAAHDDAYDADRGFEEECSARRVLETGSMQALYRRASRKGAANGESAELTERLMEVGEAVD